MIEQEIAFAVAVFFVGGALVLTFIGGLVVFIVFIIEEETSHHHHYEEMVTMVKTCQQHIATMEQAERRAEFAAKMIVTFPLYVIEKFIDLHQSELLLADQEALSPEMEIQIKQRLDQLEYDLDRIEEQTLRKLSQFI